MDMDNKQLTIKSKFEKISKNTPGLDEQSFRMGWNECEDTWLLDEPDKDLRISELEEELNKAQSENYEKAYFMLHEKHTKQLAAFAKIRTLANNEDISKSELVSQLNKILDDLFFKTKA